MDLLRRHLGSLEGQRVLDVGCGVGEFMELLREQGAEPYGVDGNEAQVAEAGKHGLTARVADLDAGIPFESEEFSLISCLEVIEHIARAEFLLKEIWRVLRPGGHLLLSTPNFSYINHRIRYLLGFAPWNEGIHLRYFNRDRLLSLVEGTGFPVIGSNSFGPVPVASTIYGRLMNKPLPLWRTGGVLENLFAYDLVYLLRKPLP
jgi:methionine biosynthesis protein MetW